MLSIPAATSLRPSVNDRGRRPEMVVAGAGGLLFFAPLLLILFRQKYPRWWFDWNRELQRLGARVGVYLALMDDRYPSTDEHQSVHLDYPYPDAARDLNRWLPLVRWLLAIPHYVVLFFLDIAAVLVVIAAWFAILFTGAVPDRRARTSPASGPDTADPLIGWALSAAIPVSAGSVRTAATACARRRCAT